MNIKLNHFWSLFLLLPIFFSISSTPVFGSQPIERCIKTLWFTICIPIPPRPTPFPIPSLPPFPKHSPKPTPTPKPLVIGAALKDYTKPKGHNCDIKVPSQFSTIQAGIDSAVNGQTVCVSAGTYNEDVELNKSITLAGDGATNTSVINGLTQHCPCQGTVWILADNAILEGFIINGSGSDYTNAAVHIAESVSGATVRYNKLVAGIGGLALLTDGFQNNHSIQNNVLEGNNSPQIAQVNGLPSVGKPSDGISFLNNTFVGTINPTSREDSGIELVTQATNNQINGNVFNATGTIHEILQCSYSSNTINNNNFNSHSFSSLTLSPIKVRAGFDGITNAENNWWGDLDPSDNFQGNVDFTPFAISPFAEN